MNMRPLQYLYIFIGKEIDDVWRFDIDLKILYIVYMDNNKGQKEENIVWEGVIDWIQDVILIDNMWILNKNMIYRKRINIGVIGATQDETR